jgi:hypothetical protein
MELANEESLSGKAVLVAASPNDFLFSRTMTSSEAITHQKNCLLAARDL